MKRPKKIRKAPPVSPTQGMRRFVGGAGFLVFMLASLLYLLLHQRAISTELQFGAGGIWCTFGSASALCLAISTVLAFFSAKTRLLPALAPIIGLGGIGASLVMMFVVKIKGLGSSGNLLGVVEEAAMLVFLAAAFVAVLLLMMTGIGLPVEPRTGPMVTAAAVTALILFTVRAMYSFSSLITALSRNLLLKDGVLRNEISWILRSVPAGIDGAQTMYYDRLLDSVGAALLMLSCIPMLLRFKDFFTEEKTQLEHTREIPRDHPGRTNMSGYDEYTQEPVDNAAQGYELDKNGYYVENSAVKLKFKRRERSEAETEEIEPDSIAAEETASEQPATYVCDEGGEVYDDYAPGEGLERFRQLNLEAEQAAAQPEAREPVKVKLQPAIPKTPDPNDPEIWSRYRK